MCVFIIYIHYIYIIIGGLGRRIQPNQAQPQLFDDTSMQQPEQPPIGKH